MLGKRLEDKLKEYREVVDLNLLEDIVAKEFQSNIWRIQIQNQECAIYLFWIITF